jgi:hypothetical protein
MNENMFYPNLVPCQADYSTCTSAMNKVFDLAPSDSNVSAFINLLADGTYHTVISIIDLNGPFKSESRMPSLVASVQQAQRGILATLSDWKKTRV